MQAAEFEPEFPPESPRAGRLSAIAAWLRRRGAAVLVFALLIVVWEAGVWLSGVKEYLLPPPDACSTSPQRP